MNRHVLIVAYYFPPMGLSGVQRTVKFAKYLPAYGWIPTVLTVSPGGYYAYDKSLLKEVEEAGVKVVRTGSFDPTRFYGAGERVAMPREFVRKLLNRISQTMFIPDNKIGWKRKALAKGKRLLRNNKFDIIFSTAPPFTDHIIGRNLKKITGVPLILDYRDAWLDYQFAFYLTPLHKFFHYRLEQSCTRAANKIIVVNRKIKILLLKHYPYIDYNDIHIIPHGFDPEDFIINSLPPVTAPRSMRVTHTGTFIEDITPVPLLRAVHKVYKENPKLRGRIKLTFAGVFRKEHETVIRKLGLQNDVEILGYVEHRECTKLMMQSDILYIHLGKRKNSEHITTGKLYDYLGARKPILASVPDGVVRQTVKDLDAGIITEPGDVDHIACALVECFEKFQRRELPVLDEEKINKYSRIKLTEDLVRIFTQVLEN